MKVLIVEDDAISQGVVKAAIEKCGHQAVTSDNGLQAWNLYDRQPFRIIVSDWKMPEMDGLALCQKVRQRPETNYTYFILLTIESGNENYDQAIKTGVDDFLTKPLKHNELRSRLHVAERILGFTMEIHQLKSLLPICTKCKKIRDDKGYWQRVEAYFQHYTGMRFTHGLCPECIEEFRRENLSAKS